MTLRTIQDVIVKMEVLLAEWDRTNDHRAVFVRSYRIITVEMERAISAGEFEDPQWMEALDIQFAKEYFDAIDAYEQQTDSLSECWRQAFDIAVKKQSSVLQDLTIGMLAHIVRDLPVAMFEVGLPPETRAIRLRDYEKSNDLLGALVGDVQAQVSNHYSFMLNFLDRFAGNNDEKLTDIGIRLARAKAWHAALDLCDANNEKQIQRQLGNLDEKASSIARAVSASNRGWRRLSPFIRRIDGILATIFLRK